MFDLHLCPFQMRPWNAATNRGSVSCRVTTWQVVRTSSYCVRLCSAQPCGDAAVEEGHDVLQPGGQGPLVAPAVAVAHVHVAAVRVHVDLQSSDAVAELVPQPVRLAIKKMRSAPRGRRSQPVPAVIEVPERRSLANRAGLGRRPPGTRRCGRSRNSSGGCG